jgi:hypothetical protein
MKSSKKVFGFSLVAVVLAVAGTVGAATSWTAAARVTSIYAGYPTKDVFVLGLENKGACKSSLIQFTTTSSDPDKVLSIANAAYLAGKKLSCAVNGCTGDYQLGFQCVLSD